MMRSILAPECRAVNQTYANLYWTLALEVVGTLVAVNKDWSEAPISSCG